MLEWLEAKIRGEQTCDVASVLNFGDFIIEDKKLAFSAQARDFPTLPNLGMLCHDEGFDDFQI